MYLDFIDKLNKTIIMVSVSDALGGINNYTKAIHIEKQPYLNLDRANQYLNTVLGDSAKEISYIVVLSKALAEDN